MLLQMLLDVIVLNFTALDYCQNTIIEKNKPGEKRMLKNVMWNILYSSNNKERESSQAPLMRQVGHGLTIEPRIRKTPEEDLYSYAQH